MTAPPPVDRVQVVVRDVSVGGLLAVIQHLDDVIRELALIETGRASGTARSTVPESVLRVMDATRRVLYGPKEAISRQVAEAWSAGRERLDVSVALSPRAGPAIYEVLEAFETVDAFSVGDEAMLIPPAPPEVRAFRRWFLVRVAEELDAVVGAEQPQRRA